MPERNRRDPRAGHVPGRHRERIRAAQPAPDRLAQRLLVLGAHVEKRRRPGPAVEVLVRAADGEVDAVVVEPDRQHAGAVAEVEQGERPGGVGGVRDRAHVGDRRRAVVDVGEGDERGLLADRRAQSRRFCPDDVLAVLPRQTLQHVAVGREVGRVGDDLAAARAGGQGGGGQLVEADGRRVGEQGLTGGRAEQVLAEPVADPDREPHPALVPAADEALPPLVVDEPCDRFRRVLRQPAQRVAVEIDQPGRRGREAVEEGGERVGGVELGGRPHLVRDERVDRRGCPCPRRAARDEACRVWRLRAVAAWILGVIHLRSRRPPALGARNIVLQGRACDWRSRRRRTASWVTFIAPLLRPVCGVGARLGSGRAASCPGCTSAPWRSGWWRSCNREHVVGRTRASPARRTLTSARRRRRRGWGCRCRPPAAAGDDEQRAGQRQPLQVGQLGEPEPAGAEQEVVQRKRRVHAAGAAGVDPHRLGAEAGDRALVGQPPGCLDIRARGSWPVLTDVEELRLVLRAGAPAGAQQHPGALGDRAVGVLPRFQILDREQVVAAGGLGLGGLVDHARRADQGLGSMEPMSAPSWPVTQWIGAST